MQKQINCKLVECSWNIDGNKMFNNYFENIYNSCTVYIVLLVIFFIISKSRSA